METIRVGGSDSRPLLADLYCPEGNGPHPVLVGVPGGAWFRGDRKGLRHWGAYFAAAGIAFLSIEYRRSTDGPVFPGNVEDVAEALRYVANRGADHGLDTARNGLLGASAGAHLASLAVLSDAFETPPIRLLVGVYGVYDLVDQWQADRAGNAKPGEDFIERMIGCTPYDDPRRYFDASPIRHVTYAKNTLPTLLVWGAADRDVLPRQSEAFATALRQARFLVMTRIVGDAGHIWFSEDPLDDPHGHSIKVAGPITRFVRQFIGPTR